jgi:hypothetical protein
MPCTGEVLPGVRLPPRGQLPQLRLPSCPDPRSFVRMRSTSHALGRGHRVDVRVSRGVHAETSRRANSEDEGRARRRTEAGHVTVLFADLKGSMELRSSTRCSHT